MPLMIMKATLFLFLVASSALAVLAGPLQRSQVAADAKWVLHLDVASLLPTQVGDRIGREAIDPKMARPVEELKKHLNFEFDWRRIRSVTLYGSEYGGPERLRGVALLDTDMDLARAFDAALQKQAEWGQAAGGALQLIEAGPAPLYCINEDLYIAFQQGLPAVISKARKTAIKAREVLMGASPSLEGTTTFTEFPAVPNSFFLVVAAQGFSDVAPVPPQAKVLRMAEGLRLVLGEAGGQVSAGLAMTAKTDEVARQMHQVVQGMLALVSLSQTENPDVVALARGLRVAVQDRTVSAELSLPVATILQKMDEKKAKSAVP
jgi:hypothetical protein